MVDLLLESVIDFPKSGLSTNIWIKSGNTFTIKPDVKSKILSILESYPDVDLTSIAQEIRIVGSICSNTYSDDADIDVHIVPKKDSKADEAFQKEVMKWVRRHEDEPWFNINGHPIEIYIQLNAAQDLLSDGCYDLLEDKWLAGPKIVSMDYNPYEDFAGIFDDIRSSVREADNLFGELKRDVIDFDVIKDAINRLPVQYQNKLLVTLKQKLEEIEEDIVRLYKERKDWSDARKNASKPDSVEQARNDIELAKSWKNTNAIFKMISRYRYMKTIQLLEKLANGRSVKPSDVEIIKHILRKDM